jgi:hypothetical protein
MKKSLFATALLLNGFSLAASVYALDLTPHTITTSYNGFQVNRYFFEDSGKQMEFRIDGKMTVKGASGEVAFKFKDFANAGMQILKSPKNAEAAFDEKGLDSYREDARALVPASATEVQLDQENPGAIAINGWTSHQFLFTYKLFGVPYRRSVIFLNYNKTEQLILDVRAPAPEFDKVYLRSYQVLNSLSERRASDSGVT